MFTAGFIGLGLIGGSIAKALKKADTSIRIVAYNRSHAPLIKAHDDNIVDVITYEIDDNFSECDIIFLCTPVEFNSLYLATLKPFIKEGCIVTDVGSVKGYIHNTVKELGMEKCFIGGHPMAGSEKTGYMAATDSLLENAYYAITPTTSTTKDKLDFYISVVKLTKAIPVVVEPEAHDYAVAGISHVPHLIAAGLVNVVHDNDTPDHLMKLLAAGGFKDITRIASSSATMWSQICSTNQKQISYVLDKYISYMQSVKDMVDASDEEGIAQLFVDSKEYRDSINVAARGPLLPNYYLICDLEDKEGALNRVTTLLAHNHISIRNMEIIHNREYSQGVLQIEFYDEHSLMEATSILENNNYKTY